MKRRLSLILAALMLGTTMFIPSVQAEEFDNVLTYDVADFNVAPISGKIVIYPNDTASPRVLASDEYKLSNEGVSESQIKDNTCFRQAFLLIFDKDGRLCEAGANLLANVGGRTNSPQLSVTIPAGGFMLAFDGITPQPLRKAYDTAMEGAMLYNATMSTLYDMYGSYDKNAKTLTVKYNNPEPVSATATKFLFIGNSSTYFSGTPIKFKGLCIAAGLDVDVDYSTFGSAYWHEFANADHERGKFMRNKLNTNKYDYVVLQDAAGASLQDSLDSLKVIIPLIQANGATPLFYMRYSSTGDFSEREATAYKYHKNYTRFGKEYNAKVSPVADAFIQSLVDNPGVDLLADDRSHHSQAGAYLAACCWLYTYLGVDPRGNTYYANLPEATAKALQNTAYKTCTEGYKYPDDPGNYVTIDGVDYNNIALDRPYTVVGKSYNPTKTWTDTNKDTGKPLGKYTDGMFAPAGDDGAIGAYEDANVTVTIDLGYISEVKRVFSDVFGGAWGIPAPENVSATVQFSNDGETFTEPAAVNLSETEKTINNFKRREMTFDATDVSARYVRLNYHVVNPSTTSTYICLWLSEICVYGVKGETGGDPVADFIPGDVNGNNKIDTSDYAMCKRAYLRTYDLNAEQLKRADINGNSKVDASEYAMIKRHYLKTYVIPGAEGK